MNISEISRALADRVETVAKYILPHGVREGSEWRVGSVHGEAGKSLGVRLNGTSAGVWSDFATGEAGDLVDLWASVRCNRSMPDALTEIKNYLNIREPDDAYRKNYTRPEKPKCSKPKAASAEYLETRGFNQTTIDAYQIAADGRNVYFPYLRNGELIMCKWRSITEKKTAPTTKDQEPCLFGWQAIPNNQREIYVTEGEFDAMAMFQMGYPALSVPFGGGVGAKQQWIETEFKFLDRFESIYLCLDNDEAGRQAQKEIAKRLGIERCYAVTLPAKDANECLLKGLDISKSIKQASSFDPINLKRAGEYTEEVIALFYPPEGKEVFIPVPWEKAQDKIGIREAELSLWNGMNGSGKSQIVGYVAMRAIQAGKRVFIASMELKPATMLKRMGRQAAAVSNSIPSIPYIRDVQSVFNESLWIYECTGTAKSEEVLQTIRYTRKRYGVEFFVIDSLMKCGIDEDDYNGQKRFVEALCDLKNELDCHIALVTHSRKQTDESRQPNKMDVKGSGAITDLADTVFSIWRNKIKENELENPGEDADLTEIEEKPDVILRCDKQRNGEWEGKIMLWFDKYTWQYLEGPNRKPIPMIPNWSIENRGAL